MPVFEPLHHAMADLISHPTSGEEAFTILDSGCGEGSHLNALCGFDYAGKTAMGAGIDLSKDGIVKASKTFKDQMWAVADVACAPFMTANLMLSCLFFRRPIMQSFIDC